MVEHRPRLAALDQVIVMWWRALKIAWRIVWGTIELGIVVYVLSAIRDGNTSLIIGVLGLIYATIRSLFLNVGMVFVHLGTGLDRELYELKRLLRSLWQEPPDLVQFPEELRPPDTEAVLGRFYVDAFIAWAFMALLYLVCLLHVFSKL